MSKYEEIVQELKNNKRMQKKRYDALSIEADFAREEMGKIYAKIEGAYALLSELSDVVEGKDPVTAESVLTTCKNMIYQLYRDRDEANQKYEKILNERAAIVTPPMPGDIIDSHGRQISFDELMKLSGSLVVVKAFGMFTVCLVGDVDIASDGRQRVRLFDSFSERNAFRKDVDGNERTGVYEL